MADDNPQAPTGQQVAVRPVRSVVADTIPVFDTDRFEHYGRIAAVMAKSNLVPDTLIKDREAAQANCFQVVEMADRWGYSPFAVAQCASVVYGKLVFEGKLIHAVMQSKLGVDLQYYYKGTWGTDDYRVYVTDVEITEEQFEQLKPKSYPFGLRMVDGSVGEWKTFEKDNKTTKGNWLKQPDMQLAYRGARTWVRRYEPALLLGVYSDDEMDELAERRLNPPEPQPQLTSGFGDGPAPKRARKARDAAPPDDSGEAPEGSQAPAEAAGEAIPPQPEVQDAEFEDAKPEPERREWPAAGEVYLLDDDPALADGGRQSYRDGKPYAPVTPDGVAALPSYSGHAPPPTATGSAPAAEPEPATSETATPASGDGAAATSSPTAPEPPTDDGVKAPRDTIYRLATDVLVGEDGRLPTYLNGQPYSRVKANAKAQPPVYDFHADAEEPEEEAAPPAAEAPPAAGEPEANPLGEAFGRIKAATNYLGGKQVLKAVAATEAFKAAPEPMKAKLREALWDLYGELKEDGKETVEIHEDLALMRGFLEFGATSVAEIDAIWPVFWKRGAYKAAGPGDQAAITDLMVRRKHELKGGA